jgi:hypothetical protein
MLLLLPFFDAHCFLLLSRTIEALSAFKNEQSITATARRNTLFYLLAQQVSSCIIFQQTVTLNVIVQTAVND